MLVNAALGALSCLSDVYFFWLVAQQFQDGQLDSKGKANTDTPPVSTTIHILSLLLRLRQCCCHLSLLKLVIMKGP